MSMTSEEARGLVIEDNLPWAHWGPTPVPDGMVGGVIVGFGGASGARLEGGGLIIDVRPAGQTDIVRYVFAMNEAGMWLEAVVTLEKP